MTNRWLGYQGSDSGNPIVMTQNLTVTVCGRREKDAVLLPAIHIDCEKLKAWLLLSASLLGGINPLKVPQKPLTTRALWWGARLYTTRTLYVAAPHPKCHGSIFMIRWICGNHNHWVQCTVSDNTAQGDKSLLVLKTSSSSSLNLKGSICICIYI